MLVDNITVKIHFSDTVILDVKADNYLVGFTLNMELSDSLDKLTSNISANELSISLVNNNSIFTPTNSDSPYFGLIDDGLKIEVFDLTTKLGEFYVTDWNAPVSSGKSTASIHAVDKLQNVLNTPIDGLEVDSNISIGDYISKLLQFSGFNVTDIIIDETLTDTLDYTTISGSKLVDALNNLSIAGDCYIYINTDGKVVAKSKEISGGIIHNIGIDDITKAQNGKSVLYSTNKLSLGYSDTTLSDIEDLLKVDNITLTAGLNQLNDYKLKSNMFEVDNIKVKSVNGSYITSFVSSLDMISMDITNPALEEVASIIVRGSTVSPTRAYVTELNQTLIDKYGVKELKIDNNLIQYKSYATTLLSKLWLRAIKTTPYMTATVKVSDFNYRLADICQVTATVVGVNMLGYLHSIEYTWVGGNSVRVSIGVKELDVVV